MSECSWHTGFSLPKTKKSAKPLLIEIATQVLRTCNAPLEINLVVAKYNILDKLKEEVNKLTEDQACECLKQIKKSLEKWS